MLPHGLVDQNVEDEEIAVGSVRIILEGVAQRLGLESGRPRDEPSAAFVDQRSRCRSLSMRSRTTRTWVWSAGVSDMAQSAVNRSYHEMAVFTSRRSS